MEIGNHIKSLYIYTHMFGRVICICLSIMSNSEHNASIGYE